MTGITFGEAIERYLAAKAQKRSIRDDRNHLKAVAAYLGAGTPLLEITAAKIAQWKAQRLSAVSPATKRGYQLRASTDRWRRSATCCGWPWRNGSSCLPSRASA